ncbi:hypothetical protein BAUCODRAFT_103240 [Baudoinia panamericana UAMH 10762]|uniref:FAD-binding domain-containing protein n=1 Tax=Baudoinia panamericana (strain UAMH 10762) TaxID=717646 RepID=M2LVT3_BAUPA|nr:uncharacterized protein BAUCODRAFT_103240 [Baudoinia panamericana UAMH 10762]EMC98772.1 hypothetical protein BAUCODRAFT_103240 [Baudoinia panamericana UAMH 10762]
MASNDIINGTEALSQHTSNGVRAVDYLIVGTGPAGGSLATFLAHNGLKGLMISKAASTADTPRAHITNMAAIDCLRDVGLDEDCYSIGTLGDCMVHTRWSHSMAGEEYARIFSWGNSPNRKGDYELASPSQPLDLPQTLLEPILTRYATLNGFHCRFDTELVSFKQLPNGSGVNCTLRDLLSDQTYDVHCRYLFGADGGRSRIAKALQLPFTDKPGGGFAVNLLIEADMAHLMENRMGNLHWLLQPDQQTPDWAWIGCIRMVKPWHEWLCILFMKPSAERKARQPEDYVERVRELIGDDSIEFTIKGVSTWAINETSADAYSKGDVFCLGDAVHRHPPNHGLGSNTCIQDSHNLAWKVAYVHRGWAGRALLDSYNDERQPVGLDVVTQANASLRNHINIWRLLGSFEPTTEAGKAALDVLKEDSDSGRQRRAEFQAALRLIDREEHGLGIEMNQRYVSSAVYTHDETGGPPPFDRDPLEHYHPSTYPGARLPHAWLSKAVPSKAISTIDLAGKGRFVLLTGIGGDGWEAAAKTASAKLGVPIAAHQIGFRREYEDRYLEWARLRGISESGCVLVRPDYFIAWRCVKWERDGYERLLKVMKSVLSRCE